MATPIASTVLKAFDVLNLLSQHGSLTVHECADQMGIPRSTAYRLLTTLRLAGAVEATPGGHFRVGLRVVAMGMNAPLHRRFGERCRPDLQSLAVAIGAPVSLSALTPTGIVPLFRAVGPATGDPVDGSGLAPVHASAEGKLLLAFGDPCTGEAEKVLAAPLLARTEHTITEPNALRAELETIRRRGFAEDRAESARCVYGLALPVRDPEFGTTLALSVLTEPPEDRRRLRQLYAHLLRCVGDLQSDRPPLRIAANG